MIIKNEKPPKWIYDECVKLFDFPRGTVFSFADTIYNPDGVSVPDHLQVHEETHGVQQSHDENVARVWWERYLKDPQFRVEQEVEAYHNQYKFICTKVKDKNARFRNLHMIAEQLCGPMYANMISYTDAIRRVRGNVK